MHQTVQNLFLTFMIINTSGCFSNEKSTPDVGNPDIRNTPALSAAEVANVLCAGISACGGEAVNDDMERCLLSFVGDDWNLNQRPFFNDYAIEQALCAQKSDTCDGFRKCMGVCTELSTCDGNTHVTCRNGFTRWERDCTKEGLVCDDNEFSKGCILPDAICDTEATCSGDIALWCPSEQQQIPSAKDCLKENKVCGKFGCVDDTEETCTPVPGFGFGFRCDEEDPTLIRTCVAGRPTTFSCTSLDASFRCLPDPDQAFDCTHPTAERDCEVHEKRCDGDVAIACRRGKQFRMDCGLFQAKCTLGDDPDDNLGYEVLKCVIPK